MTNETVTSKKFIQVFINGDEKNLPPVGYPISTHIIGSRPNHYDEITPTIYSKEWFLKRVDYYLAPIEHLSPDLLTKEQKEQIEAIVDNLIESTYSGYASRALRGAMTKTAKVIIKTFIPQSEQPSEAESKMITHGEVSKLLDHHNDVYGPGNDDYGRDKWPVIDKELIVKAVQPDKEQKTAEKQQYVVGFMFDNERDHVVLIRKQKPEWQKGKLNGVGGKIEYGESPLQAMYREYVEEAGVAFARWDNFLTIEYKSCVVYFFKGFSTICLDQSRTIEKEEIVKVSLNDLPMDMIYNLNWIIFMALDPDIQHSDAMEEYRSQGIQTVTDEPNSPNSETKLSADEKYCQNCDHHGKHSSRGRCIVCENESEWKPFKNIRDIVRDAQREFNKGF